MVQQVRFICLFRGTLGGSIRPRGKRTRAAGGVTPGVWVLDGRERSHDQDDRAEAHEICARSGAKGGTTQSSGSALRQAVERRTDPAAIGRHLLRPERFGIVGTLHEGWASGIEARFEGGMKLVMLRVGRELIRMMVR